MIVSVIIPCFNVEAFISECLDSVLLQTYQNIEIICIDNNSRDSTINLLREFEKKHFPKIRVFQEFKKGASAARNKGLDMATGEWIQFLDADDLLMPEKIAHQVKLVSDNKEINFIAASSFKYKIDGTKKEISVDEPDPFKALFITKLGNTCANLFNAGILKRIGGWNETLKSSQETDLMFRLLKENSKVLMDNIPLTIIRERESGQITQTDPEKNWIQYIYLRSEMLDYLKKSNVAYFERQKNFYNQMFFRQLKKMHKFDLNAALTLFERHFEKDFVPQAHPIYITLFKLLGFNKTERIVKLIRKQ